MKVFLVSVTFNDGTMEGVVFTDEEDANYAMTGKEHWKSCGVSSLAEHWFESHIDSEHVTSIKTEIEI